VVPATDYHEKYKHLIGDERAKKEMEKNANRSYGFGKIVFSFKIIEIGHLKHFFLSKCKFA
jgi:hypothetical protein